MTRDECSDDELRALYQFCQKCSLDAVDHLLSWADPGRLPPVYMVGLLRYSFARRKQLNHWEAFRGRAQAELAARGQDVSELLRGLIP